MQPYNGKVFSLNWWNNTSAEKFIWLSTNFLSKFDIIHHIHLVQISSLRACTNGKGKYESNLMCDRAFFSTFPSLCIVLVKEQIFCFQMEPFFTIISFKQTRWATLLIVWRLSRESINKILCACQSMDARILPVDCHVLRRSGQGSPSAIHSADCRLNSGL